MRRLRHAVLGAGGGIAATLAGNSYVIICVSGNGSSIDDRGKSTLRNNRAEALGGAVYLNTSMIAPDCLFPQPGPALTETCFPGGYWPKTCGFNTLDLDWQGSMAVAGGDLVAWAGDTSGFNQACTLTGAVCDVNNVTLQSTGVSRVYNTSSSNSVTEGGSKGSSARSRGSSSSSVKKEKTCVRTFDAAAAFVCSAGSGLGGKQVKLVDDTRKFQLPASFFVFVSDLMAVWLFCCCWSLHAQSYLSHSGLIQWLLRDDFGVFAYVLLGVLGGPQLALHGCGRCRMSDRYLHAYHSSTC
jgi:hypothetical protein